MRAIVLMAAMLLGAAPALATADFSCSFSDQNLSLTLRGHLGHDRTVSVGDIRAELQVGARKDVPSKLRKLEFSTDDLLQYWIHRDDLKFMFGSDNILLVIEIQALSGGRGSYKVTIDDQQTTNSIELHGSAKCY
jgi:hypothetical protein